jgi:hypothetical protein
MDQPNETLSLEEGIQAIEKLIAEQQVRIDEWLKTTRRLAGSIIDAYGEGGIADNRPVVLFWHQSDKAREISVRRWTEMCQTRDETPEAPAPGRG